MGMLFPPNHVPTIFYDFRRILKNGPFIIIFSLTCLSTAVVKVGVLAPGVGFQKVDQFNRSWNKFSLVSRRICSFQSNSLDSEMKLFRYFCNYMV